MTAISVDRSDRYDFEITSSLVVRAEPEELTAIALDPNLIPVWCKPTVVKAELLEPGDPDGLGMTMRLHLKGPLPHSFFCIVKVVDLIRHRMITMAASGDFDGRLVLRTEANGDGTCSIEVDWKVRIHQPYIRPFIRILKPVFVLNHLWGIRGIRDAMEREVARQRSGSQRAPGPKPSFPHNIAFFRRGWRRVGREYAPEAPTK